MSVISVIFAALAVFWGALTTACVIAELVLETRRVNRYEFEPTQLELVLLKAKTVFAFLWLVFQALSIFLR